MRQREELLRYLIEEKKEKINEVVGDHFYFVFCLFLCFFERQTIDFFVVAFALFYSLVY